MSRPDKEEIEQRMNELAEGDSNDSEIDGLRDIISELLDTPAGEPFATPPPGHRDWTLDELLEHEDGRVRGLAIYIGKVRAEDGKWMAYGLLADLVGINKEPDE